MPKPVKVPAGPPVKNSASPSREPTPTKVRAPTLCKNRIDYRLARRSTPVPQPRRRLRSVVVQMVVPPLRRRLYLPPNKKILPQLMVISNLRGLHHRRYVLPSIYHIPANGKITRSKRLRKHGNKHKSTSPLSRLPIIRRSSQRPFMKSYSARLPGYSTPTEKLHRSRHTWQGSGETLTGG
jgi:hypothetical protein